MDEKAQKDLKSLVGGHPDLVLLTTLGALVRSWDCTPEEMGFDELTPLDEVVRFARVAKYGDWAMLLDATDYLINNVEDEAVFALDEYQLPST